MELASKQAYDLGNLLGEFVDEYSYLYFLTEEKLKEGLKFHCMSTATGLVPLNVSYPLANKYLNPITRVAQINNWFTEDWSVLTGRELVESLNKLRFHKLHYTIFFEGDEVEMIFKQDNKILKTLVLKAKNHRFNQNISPNQQIIPWLKSVKANQMVEVEVRLINLSSERNMVNQVLDQYPGIKGEKFFNIFLNLANLKHQNIFTEEDIKKLNLKPKGLYSLYQEAMSRDRYQSPVFNNLHNLLKNNEIKVLPDYSMGVYNYIKKKIEFLEKNQMPFTKTDL